LPAPAWVFLLLTGEHAPCRLPGWPASLGETGSPSRDVVWRAHRDALIALAAEHDFQPHALTHRRPKGEAFQHWREAFLREHTY
jgi:hypothetical protein